MDNKYNISLFIFRRDLRLEDNTALIEALKSSKQVIAAFIFDPQQCTDENEFKSDNAVQFMIETLQELDDEFKKRHAKLYLFYGKTHEVISELILEIKIEAIFINQDYTPFSLKRDLDIEHLCIKHKVKLYQFADELLIDPKKIMSGGGTPYTIFTPFFKKAFQENVCKPIENKYKNFYDKSITLAQYNPDDLIAKNKNIWVHGGRKNALKILKSLRHFHDYDKIKDYPNLNTTNLSPYLKFGVCSIREAYYAIVEQLGMYHPLIRALFWRDFFTYVAYHSPFVFGHAYKEKYDKIPWENDKKKFQLWCTGKTGFPIIDAGMRQLNETGFMHNRIRMLTASFLIKDLHIDWQWGEKYFAQKLVDYDPAVNNGNWQWVASTGCDSTPYFRIFNPWLQQKKFDPDCTYIKTWVPELKDVQPKVIHTIYANTVVNYPAPIIDHKIEVAVTLKIYKKT
jgi:deoxyribodipyrimidine photo-lyase